MLCDSRLTHNGRSVDAVKDIMLHFFDGLWRLSRASSKRQTAWEGHDLPLRLLAVRRVYVAAESRKNARDCYMVTLSHLLTLASTCNHHNSFSAQVTKKSIVVRFSTRPIKMSSIYMVVTIGLSPYTLYALSKKLQMFRFNIASFCTLTTFHSTTAELLDICTSMLKYQLYAMKASDAIILLERRYHKSSSWSHWQAILATCNVFAVFAAGSFTSGAAPYVHLVLLLLLVPLLLLRTRLAVCSVLAWGILLFTLRISRFMTQFHTL